jgi:hypothetical protein
MCRTLRTRGSTTSAGEIEGGAAQTERALEGQAVVRRRLLEDVGESFAEEVVLLQVVLHASVIVGRHALEPIGHSHHRVVHLGLHRAEARLHAGVDLHLLGHVEESARHVERAHGLAYQRAGAGDLAFRYRSASGGQLRERQHVVRE